MVTSSLQRRSWPNAMNHDSDRFLNVTESARCGRVRTARRRWLRGIWTKSLQLCIPAPLAADFGPMEAWQEGLLLPLALAGPADDALVSRSLGCYDSYVADCA